MKKKITLNEEIKKIKSMMNLLNEDESMSNEPTINTDSVESIMDEFKQKIKEYTLTELSRSGFVDGIQKNDTELSDYQVHNHLREVELNFSMSEKYMIDITLEYYVDDWENRAIISKDDAHIKVLTYDGENVLYDGDDKFGVIETKLADNTELKDILIEDEIFEKIWDKLDDEGQDGPDYDEDDYNR